MSEFYRIFSSTDLYADAPQNITAFEPATRLPYALYGPTIVTHFPLFYKSQEDYNFLQRSRQLMRFQPDRKGKPISISEYCSFSEAEIGEIVQSLGSINEDVATEAIIFVLAKCNEHLAQMKHERPGLFIFNAKTLIGLHINRYANSQVVDVARKAKDARKQHWALDLANPFELTSKVVSAFLKRAYEIVAQFQDAKPPLAPGRSPEYSQEKFGGVIAWFEQTDKLLNWEAIGTRFDDRKILALKNPVSGEGGEPIVDNYLLWRRGDRNWRYTFCEGIYDYEHPKRRCAKGVYDFILRLFKSRRLEQSFPRGIPGSDYPLDLYKLPGWRMSGAQYFVIPAELLIMILKNRAHFHKKSENVTNINNAFTSAGRHTAEEAIKSLLDIEKAVLPRNAALEKLIGASAHSPGKILAIARMVRDQLKKIQDQISENCRNEVAGSQTRREEFYLCFATLSEILWKHIYGEKHKVGQYDFVSSIVIDGRALYFSNFRPFETEREGRTPYLGFTRTFFIDFGLAPDQRGRLVRRLCDIATYRMSCVKGFDRLDALQDGINQLNTEFNALVAETATLDIAKQAVTIKAALTRSLLLYQRALQFNMFVAEGVSGRRRSADGDWQLVKKQVVDIREERVPGYALLSDFLERGLAVSVMELDRIADRYENLTRRISDHMSTMRTAMTGEHAIEITQLLEKSGKLLQKSQEETEKHTSLLYAADLLVWVAGTYYAQEMLRRVVPTVTQLDALLYALGLVFVLVYILKPPLSALVYAIKKAISAWLTPLVPDRLRNAWRAVLGGLGAEERS